MPGEKVKKGILDLADKIHVEQWARDVLASIQRDLVTLHETCETLNGEDMYASGKNERVADALKYAWRVSQELNAATSGILEDAEKERQKTESSYSFWSVVYNCLYGLGPFLAAMGIMMGEKESVSEMPES